MTEASKSIASRIATGAFWTIGLRLSVRALGIVSVIILARILVPEDFGIVAKASMIASFLELISEFGLTAALVRDQQATAAHYDTVWTIHVIRGTVIAVILVALAKPAAVFLHEPMLSVILLFYALSAFLNGLENVGVVDFWKSLEFDREFKFNVYRKLTSFAVTVGVAFVWQTYWAFVAGVVTGSLVGLVASFLMAPYRPRIRLSEWRSLFDFSKWIFVHGLCLSLSTKLDTFILSRFSVTAVVGRFTVAHEIAGAASTEIAMPIARAVMPGLAKLNDEPAKFRATYTSSILVLMLFTVPAAVGVAALSELITDVVLGSKWADAADLISILALGGIMRAVSAMSASAFMSSGKAKPLAYLSIFNLLLRALAMGFGFKLSGVIGLAWGVLVGSIIQTSLAIYVQCSLNFVNPINLLAGTWRVVTSASIMFLVLDLYLANTYWLMNQPAALQLMLQILAGMAVYLLTLWGLWKLAGDTSGPESAIADFLAERFKKTNQSGA